MKIDTAKIIVPNWYDRKTLEELTCDTVSRADFRAFKEWLEDDTNMQDNISELIRELWQDFQHERSTCG